MYFDNAHHDHINPDINAQTIYGATVALARTRGEVIDAMHGLQMAFELVYASAHIHVNQTENAVAFGGDRHSVEHDATMNLTDVGVDDGQLDDVVMMNIEEEARGACNMPDDHIDGLTDISENEGDGDNAADVSPKSTRGKGTSAKKKTTTTNKRQTKTSKSKRTPGGVNEGASNGELYYKKILFHI